MTKDSDILQGDTFGHLKVIDPTRRLTHPSGSRRAALCRCDCGNIKLVSWNHLTYGRVTSCGCRAANRPHINIEPGFRVGSFTVLAEARATSERRVLLRCACGAEVTRSLYTVAAGRIPHCHARAHRPPAARSAPPVPPSPRQPGPGDRFGLRTVLEILTRPAVKTASRATRALVRCDCGNQRVVTVSSLKRSKSCGHLPRHVTHGLGGHELYEVHKAMMARCYRPTSKDYRNYGARGIKVYRPWHDVRTFVADIEREIGPRPEGKYASGWAMYTLDRIDNDRGYVPGNIKWSTRTEQRHNVRPEWRPRNTIAA